jgi:nucleotide-binding universal stress UspA family protein
MRILIAVDGSKNSLSAVKCVVDHADWYREKPAVELVTVHRPVPRVGSIGKGQLDKYYREEGEAALAAAKKQLDAARIPYTPHILVGQVAEAIVKQAKDKRCDMICIGTRGMSAIGKALVGSTASQVLHGSDIPVLLVK